MNQQGGGCTPVRVFQRGEAPHFIDVLPGGSLHGVHILKIPNISCQALAHPVGNRPLGCRRSKPVRMPDDPVGHKPAIAPAGYANPLSVNLRILLQNVIHKFHQVAVIHCPIFSPNVGKFVSPAVGASGIAEEYKIPLTCPVLHLVVKHRAKGRFGPSVDVVYRGVSFTSVVSQGLHHPAVNPHPIPIGKAEGFRYGDIIFFGNLPVKPGNPFLGMGMKVKGINLLQAHVSHPDKQGVARPDVKAVN